ncbi:hypothetical protein GINT2_001506 [Glugoides intestinalis]
MKKDTNEEQVETLSNFIDILKNIKKIRKRREESLDTMFWEYNNYNIDRFEDRESKIQKHLPDNLVHTKAFLASNLGFNRSSMDPKYIEILNRFKLDKRSSSGSMRNALHYETLKRLIIKYFEMKK